MKKISRSMYASADLKKANRHLSILKERQKWKECFSEIEEHGKKNHEK